MIQKRVIVGDLHVNCWIVLSSDGQDCVIIDPGADAEAILAALIEFEKNGVLPRVDYLLHTHGHFDHIGATKQLKQLLSGKQTVAPAICLHAADGDLYKELRTQGCHFGFSFDDPAPIDRYLTDGETFQAGTLCIQVIHTPGHSPGGTCFLVSESDGTEPVLFCGDTIFKRSIGRSDLWGGNEERLLDSIRKRILSLPDSTKLFPGHGSITTVYEEKKENSFLR